MPRPRMRIRPHCARRSRPKKTPLRDRLTQQHRADLGASTGPGPPMRYARSWRVSRCLCLSR